ncbi:site-specific integrase [uncultured Flavobacterium sp.]|uniref:tyrosine-type recombinase/integrase n=1 Tax=uncultured Flavobacterium sp. TaxID=165435 RepID=UPI0030C81433
MKILKIKINKEECYPLVYNNNIPDYIFLKITILFFKRKSFKTKYSYATTYIYFQKYLNENYNQELDKIIYNKQIDLIIKDIINFSSWLIVHINSQSSINLHLSNIKIILLRLSDLYSNDINTDYIKIQRIFNLQITEIKNKSNSYNSIPQKIIEELFSIINYKSKSNFFKNNLKTRNNLIFLLLFETGIRIGELLRLRIKDVYRHENKFYLQIKYHQNNNEDKRWDIPSLKNFNSQRFISISKNTYLIYELFIKYYRNKTKKHTFLFTNINGNPISKSMIQKIFNEVSIKINYKITPHMARHNFAENMIMYLIEFRGLETERAKDELRLLCGWTNNSSMPILYTKKYFQKIANAHNLKRLNDD